MQTSDVFQTLIATTQKWELILYQFSETQLGGQDIAIFSTKNTTHLRAQKASEGPILYPVSKEISGGAAGNPAVQLFQWALLGSKEKFEVNHGGIHCWLRGLDPTQWTQMERLETYCSAVWKPLKTRFLWGWFKVAFQRDAAYLDKKNVSQHQNSLIDIS